MVPDSRGCRVHIIVGVSVAPRVEETGPVSRRVGRAFRFCATGFVGFFDVGRGRSLLVRDAGLGRLVRPCSRFTLVLLVICPVVCTVSASGAALNAMSASRHQPTMIVATLILLLT